MEIFYNYYKAGNITPSIDHPNNPRYLKSKMRLSVCLNPFVYFLDYQKVVKAHF
jgi:hypothetical protein